MSNSAGSPSTVWRLRPAVYGAAQNYIASETSPQPRIIKTTTKQLKKIGYRPRTMIGFWNVRRLLEERTQTHHNSCFLQLEKLFTQRDGRAAAFTKAQLATPPLFTGVSLRA